MDWFQRLWLERRTGWAARKSQDQGAVVFLGDSITQGWAGSAVVSRPEVANRGISSDTTRGVLYACGRTCSAAAACGGFAHRHQRLEMAEPEIASGNVALILDASNSTNPPCPWCCARSSQRSAKNVLRQDHPLNQLLPC
jgi:hypothetical protein